MLRYPTGGGRFARFLSIFAKKKGRRGARSVAVVVVRRSGPANEAAGPGEPGSGARSWQRAIQTPPKGRTVPEARVESRSVIGSVPGHAR